MRWHVPYLPPYRPGYGGVFDEPERPWALRPPALIVVELIEGCTVGCPKCGMRGIRRPDRPYLNTMAQSTIELIARELIHRKWPTMVDFSGHGEPTARDDWAETIMWFGHVMRQMGHAHTGVCLTTSGQGLPVGPDAIGRIAELFEHALDVMVVGRYPQTAAHGRWLSDALPTILRMKSTLSVGRLPQDKWAEPRPLVSRDRWPCLITMPALGPSDLHPRMQWRNEGGLFRTAAAKPHFVCDLPMTQIHIRWNGDVCICGHDWQGVHWLGNIVETSIQDVWLGERADAARRVLADDRRRLDPCRRCRTHTGPQIDWFLRPPPTEETRRIVADSTSREPLYLRDGGESSLPRMSGSATDRSGLR